MLIPIPFRYQYTKYKFSERATKYSKLQGMAGMLGWAVGFFSGAVIYSVLMMLLDDETMALVALILGIVIGIVFTRWFRKAMGKKVAAALKEDLPKARPESAGIPVAAADGPVRGEPVPVTEEPGKEEPPAPEYNMWLVCVGGYMNGRVYPITADRPITFGRLPGNLLQFPADYPGVSREHARPSWEDGKLLLTDLGSTDGTVIFGTGQLTPMVSREMTPGDVFYIGTEENAFEIRS